MAHLRRWLAVQSAALILLAVGAPFVRAESTPGTQPSAQPTVQPTVQQDYSNAQWVQVTLGLPDQEQGIHLVDGLPDSITQPAPDLGGRQSMPNLVSPERYFSFDVADSYIHGGKNKVQMTITYRDVGLTPIFLEYDSLDPLRPDAKVEEVTKKRVEVATRTNSEGTKTAYVELDDARFLGTEAGGADFRIFSTDDLVISTVSVYRSSHEEPTVIRIVLDGKLLTFDPNEVQPFVHPATSRTLVPLRAIFRALGFADSDITYDNDTRTVMARKGDKAIALTIDDVAVRVNGKVQADKLDQPATIVAGRTVVPLRFIATQFGLTVKWDEPTHTVTLTSPAAQPQPQPAPTHP